MWAMCWLRGNEGAHLPSVSILSGVEANKTLQPRVDPSWVLVRNFDCCPDVNVVGLKTTGRQGLSSKRGIDPNPIVRAG